MVTFAQAQERAERWVNASVAADARRAVVVREFDLGFVAWAEGPAGHPTGGRLVIARDSGETTLWPGLPVDAVIDAYLARYGDVPAAPEPEQEPPAVDLEATSFLLTPPQWLQEAADRAGIPDNRPGTPADSAPTDDTADGAPEAADAADAADAPVGAHGTPGAGLRPEDVPEHVGPEDDESQPAESAGQPVDPFAVLNPQAEAEPGAAPGTRAAPGGTPGGSPWDATDTSGTGSDDASMPPPATVFSTPVVNQPDSPAGPEGADLADAEARTAIMPARGELPATAVHQAVPGRQTPTPPPPPGPPPSARATGAADIAEADTAKASAASRDPQTGGDSSYVPTQMVSAVDLKRQSQAAKRDTPPPPPPPVGTGGGDGVHHAATMLAHATPPPGPAGSTPPPPSPPPSHGGGLGAATPPPASGAYGYPQSRPTVGSGYMAVLRYRAPDGSEARLIRRSTPGTPHPEWQLLHELHALGVPPQQVIELHTELQSCSLPGGYCSRMIQETWPQVRVTHTAPYGSDHGSRQAGVRHLVEHQDELEQYADGPARTAPVRVPVPSVPTAPAVGLDVIGQELQQAFGPQGVFRFDQQSVSRQGVPDIVAQTLVWSGVPLEIGPFFWAQARPGTPIPTLAELAQERGVQPASDAGSYLVVGNDFGRQLCVQYGTAYIVAVPVEAGPGGAPARPQFVNSSLPQFARSMALLGRMWRLRFGLTPEQAGHWTSDFQLELASLDGQALADPENWWSVLVEQMWDGLL
ncbi:SUKH-4 family immunity protein [Streptomyces lonarensis]|uniref:Nucleic acid/nucleotide deaminase of polymorphic system toxin n=2 Tax=Streptomyces lonarensis TaxID=700599 RepID=A0A7X6D1W7_9ACTN|nr:SUKH-4 family immunity protein [Streptomyces lonarensis]NJQ06693.1 hypothetical protein [Streptomyces lonarensis]